MATNTRLPGVGKISQLKTSGEHFGLDKDDIRSGDPVRACELCGLERASSDMLNFICVLGSPGHYSIMPLQHPEQEHWACSPAHWKELAYKVVDEMESILLNRHAAIEGSVHNGNKSN